jgi:hypothetical protein
MSGGYIHISGGHTRTLYVAADPVLGDSVVEKLRKAWVR